MKENSAPTFATGQPRYVLLAQSLMQDITSERYAVGGLLPTESELCRQFGVSRHTVREALRRLREAGLVSRHQGVGTRVKAKTTATRYVQSMASLSDLMQYAQKTRLVVRSTREVVAAGPLCDLLRCKAGQRWLLFEGPRFAGRATVPMAYTQVYIPPAYGGIRQYIGSLKVPIYTLIEKHFGERIVEVRQEIGAVGLSLRVSRLLHVRPNSAGLSITRHYFGADDRLLEVAVNLHPTLDRYRYSMRLRLESQANGPPH
ncbi:MAG: GntR family transcriptional regulator [Sulfuricaulis sp.]|nr:GntR family transcriptional regulator [Sulfuricaulis sp.]